MSIINCFSKYFPRHFGILLLNRKNFLFLLLAVLAALGVFTGIFSCYSYTLPQNGDSVCSLLVGADIARGNLLLKDWAICHVSYYFTDLLPWGFFVWLFGYRIYLLYIIPSMFSAVLILLLAGVATVRKKKHSWYFAWFDAILLIAMILCLVLQPKSELNRFVVSSMIHMGMIFYLFGALLCIKFYSCRKTLSLTLLFLFNFCGIFSDTFWLAYWLLPLLIVTLLSDIFQKNRLSYRFLVFSFLGVITGYICLKLCCTYFFTIYPRAYNFLPLDKIGTRILDILHSLLLLFNADAFNDFLFATKHQAFNLFVLPVMLAVLVFLMPVRRNFFSVFISWAMLCITLILGFSKEYNLPFLRYFYFFVPLFFFLFISGLVDMRRARIHQAIRLLAICFVCVNVCFLGKALYQTTKWNNGNSYWKQIVKALKKEQLSCGIGDFWKAQPITAFSKEKIRVRVIQETPSFHFFRWWASRSWEKEFFEFILLEKNRPTSDMQKFWESLAWKKFSVHDLDVYVFHRPMNRLGIVRCFQKRKQYFDASKLFVTSPGYKQNKTIVLEGLSSMDKYFTPPLPSKITRENASAIILEPKATQFGPYTSLPKGSYHITIRGKHLQNVDFKSYSLKEKKFFPIKNLRVSENVVKYDINLSSPVSNIEFVSTNSGTDPAEIYEIQIQNTDPEIIADFLSGFSESDGTGIGSEGKKSILKLLLPERKSKNVTVRFEIQPFLSLKSVDIFSNKRKIGSWEIKKQGKQFFDLTLNIPPSSQEFVDLELVYHSPARPCDIDRNSRDTRLLAIYIYSIKYVPPQQTEKTP